MALTSAERAILVGLDLKTRSRPGALPHAHAVEESLDEMKSLADTAGAHVEETIVQSRQAPDSATLIGSGKLDELRRLVNFHDADMVLFDAELTPTQLRNLERALDCKILDRTQLILDIFARRARTREGQLQVELAQLNYLLPRLTGRGEELSRLGGGIGTRGPGEQKLETDRRRIRDRVRKIQESIETVRRQRATRRQARHAQPLGMIALVGYTNAGKSTLFNALTHAEVLTSPQMFATLDPTVRALRLPSRRKVLLSDTVGFLRDLPPDLIAAFRATLEEVQEAALIIHVSDISNPHHAEHDADVLKVLDDLGVRDRLRLNVFNKTDQLSEDDLAALKKSNQRRENAVFTSAVTGAGLDELLVRIDAMMPVDPLVHLHLRIPVSDGRHLSLVHACGRVLQSQVLDGHMDIEAELPESLARRLGDFVSPSPQN